MKNIEEIMYTVGQIAARVFSDGNVPPTMLSQLLSHPLRGIGLMSRLPEFRQADQEEMGRLMEQIPGDFEFPKTGVSLGKQASFWTGFYHYLAAEKSYAAFDRVKLAACGEALFGTRWQSDLADALGINSRRVREWVSGHSKLPFGVYIEILALLRTRQMSIESIIQQEIASK